MSEFRLTAGVRYAGASTQSVDASLSYSTEVANATAFTLSGGTTGFTGVANTFTVSPNGPLATQTVVSLIATNAALSVAFLTFNAGSSAAQTFTVTRLTDGTSTVSMSNNAGLAEIGDPQLLVTTQSAAITSFALTSSASGTVPFSIGHAFKRGEVSSSGGITLSGSSVNAQMTPRTYWTDGSVRFGVIAGTYQSTGGVPGTISMQTGGGASSGTALTTTNLKATGISASVSAGSFGSAVWSADSADWDAPVQAYISGNRMSSWVFRKPIGSDPHLSAWMEVRLWATGDVEVLPWVENGYLTSSIGLTNKNATYTFSLGGSQRFSQAIDVKYRTRVALMSGVFSYWLGTDKTVTPRHDVAYLIATKNVPNYGLASPSESTLNSLIQTYTPNTLSDVSAAMGVAGGGGSFIRSMGVFYLLTGDARAYRAAMAFGLSGGSWSTHHRDVDQYPIQFLNHPNISLEDGTVAAGTGGTNGTAVTSHEPSFGYLAHLLSGWLWFAEEAQFWAGFNYLQANSTVRRGIAYAQNTTIYPAFSNNGSDGIMDPTQSAYTGRNGAWAFCMLSQALAITPPSHPCFASYKNTIEKTLAFFYQVFVAGTHDRGFGEPSRANNALGLISGPSATGAADWFGAGWMMCMQALVYGAAYQMDLPHARAFELLEVVKHASKLPIGLSGGRDGGYNWRRMATYDFHLGDGTTSTVHATFGASLAGLERVFQLSPMPTTPGLSLLNHSANFDMQAFTSTVTYFGQAMAALAVAVDLGMEGAQEGWNRMSGASNFAAVSATFSQIPEFSVIPRQKLPSWVPAPGQTANISLNSMLSVAACPGTAPGACWFGNASSNTTAPFINWTGAAYCSGYGELGAMAYWGGGHGGGEDLTIYLFDFNTRIWKAIGPGNPPAKFPSFDPDWGDNIYNGNYVLAALHTYNYPEYVPPKYDGAGALGSWILPMVVMDGGRPTPHMVDLQTGVWKRVCQNVFPPPNEQFPYSGSFFDSSRGKLWFTSYTNPYPYYVDFNGPAANRTIARNPTEAWGMQQYYGRTVYVEENDTAVTFVNEIAQTYPVISVMPMSAGAPSAVSCNQPPQQPMPNTGTSGGFGVDWCPETKAFYLYEGRGSTVVYKLTPSSMNFQTCTWSWSTETFSNPASSGFSQGNQPFSRWRYIRPLKSFAWSEGSGYSAQCLDGVTRDGVMQLWRPLGT